VAIALDSGTILYGFDIDFGCSEDCTPDEEDPPNDCDWCDGETVPTVLAFRPHIPSDTTGMADCNFCELINDRTFIMKYNLGCHYSTEGDLHAPLSDDDPCEWQPGCDAGPDSIQTCLTLALNTAIDEDTGHLVMSGLVMLSSNFFTCRIHFEQDYDITEERPDCQAFFSGVVRLPFKEFSGFVDGVPCKLCGVGIESGPTDTSTWYLEVVGL
jgi:hypothetical protein